jgi:L-iditol 2-dehydrogenase
MKALKLISNGKFLIEKRKIPRLKKNHSVVKIKYAGICSSDIYRSFFNKSYFYPLVMGHEAMGVIVKTDSKKLKVNDKVVIFPLKPCFKCEFCKINKYQICKSYDYYGSRCDGAFQEYLQVNNWNLMKIPNKINDKDAVLIEPLSVMVHVKNILFKQFNKNKITKKNKGAIIGGGFLGLVLSNILKYYKITNFVLYEKNNFKIKFGIRSKLNIKSNFYLNKNISNKFDWVVETSGDPKSYIKSIEIVKPGGSIICMSNISNGLLLDSKIISLLVRKELHLIGSWNSNYNNKDNEWKESFNLIQKGISPSKFITHEINLIKIPSILKKLYLHKKRKKLFNSIKTVVRI